VATVDGMPRLSKLIVTQRAQHCSKLQLGLTNWFAGRSDNVQYSTDGGEEMKYRPASLCQTRGQYMRKFTGSGQKIVWIEDRHTQVADVQSGRCMWFAF